jgi:alpha-tubulin suppressor-like RCC1 family protein
VGSAGLAAARRSASLVAACALLGFLASLGAAGPARAEDASSTPEPVRLPPITALTVGSQHACAIVEGGDAWCWGFSSRGGLGGGPDVTSSDLPVHVAFPRPVTMIDAGFDGTCAITDDGAAWCWGENESGEVGDGTTTDRFAPVRVEGLPGRVVEISRGFDHACALLDDGTARCWGDNVVGELGNDRQTGDPSTEPLPVTVVKVPRLASISAGAGFTCALAAEGSAWCWGNPTYGEIGRGDDPDSRTPGMVTGLGSGVDVIAAGDDQACAIRDGELLCWGLMDGALIETDPDAASWNTPRSIDLGVAVKAIAVENGYHRCALDEAGETWCWGNAEARQIGPAVAEGTDWVSKPVRMDLPNATQVATGYDFTCALFAADDLRCWGDGDPVARNPWTGETGPTANEGFREPGPLVPTLTTYIPTPRDVSTDPPVVGANLLLAAFVMILFTIAGELLNRTLAENEDAMAARGGALGRLRRARARFDGALERRLGHGRRLAAVQLAGIAAIYGLVFSLLDRTWDPLSITGLWLFLSMAVAFGLVGIADDLACWSVARRWGIASDLDLRPGNLLVAVTSTFASRIVVLVPGVMVGMPEALEVDTDALDERRRGRLAGVGLGTLVAVGLAAWGVTLATSLVGADQGEGVATLVGGIQAFFLVVFAVTVQNGFAQLLAFRGTPGRVLRTSHRWIWLLGLLGVSFLFWHTLVNPRGDLAEALGETNVVAFVATAVGFILFAVGLSLWFTVRRRRSLGRAVALDAAPAAPAASAAAVPSVPAVPLAPASPAPTVLSAPASSPAVAPAASIALVGPPAAPGSPAAFAAAVPSADPPPAPVTVVAAPVPGWVAPVPGWAAPGPTFAAAPAGPGPLGVAEGIAFDLVAVNDRRLTGAVRLAVRPDGVGLTGSWIRQRADRAFRAVNAIVVTLLVVGLLGIALLSTMPGFRFYRVPWLLPSSIAVLLGLAVLNLVAKQWRERRRWTGEVRVPPAMLVSVRTALDRVPLVLACIFLTPLGGAIYAAVVGPKVVRLRGPFDPERTTVLEVRLRCRDRDEASDVAARLAATRPAGGPSPGGWQ